MGQKSDAVFAGMHFIKYYDATQNETFLRERAYPFLERLSTSVKQRCFLDLSRCPPR